MPLAAVAAISDCGPSVTAPLTKPLRDAAAGSTFTRNVGMSAGPSARRHAISSIVGRTIWLSGADYEVIGVLPPRFEFVDAKLVYERGDLPVRVGGLARDVWDAILHAGVIVADISVPTVGCG